MPRAVTVMSVSLLAVCLGAGAARAQTPGSSTPTTATAAGAAGEMPAFSSLFTSIGGDLKHVFSARNLLPAGAGAAGAATAHVWDRSIADAPRHTGAPADALRPGRIVGTFGVQAGAAFATYGIGRITGHPRVATVGVELFRAQIVAQITTQALKFSTQRTRPDGGARSLPSGHASSAFATASVLQAEFGWKAGLPANAVAVWVAASRVHDNRHYLSDVVAGAAVGILAGRSVTFGRGRARLSVSALVGPGGGVGVQLIRTR